MKRKSEQLDLSRGSPSIGSILGAEDEPSSVGVFSMDIWIMVLSYLRISELLQLKVNSSMRGIIEYVIQSRANSMGPFEDWREHLKVDTYKYAPCLVTIARLDYLRFESGLQWKYITFEGYAKKVPWNPFLRIDMGRIVDLKRDRVLESPYLFHNSAYHIEKPEIVIFQSNQMGIGILTFLSVKDNIELIREIRIEIDGDSSKWNLFGHYNDKNLFVMTDTSIVVLSTQTGTILTTFMKFDERDVHSSCYKISPKCNSIAFIYQLHHRRIVTVERYIVKEGHYGVEPGIAWEHDASVWDISIRFIENQKIEVNCDGSLVSIDFRDYTSFNIKGPEESPNGLKRIEYEEGAPQGRIRLIEGDQVVF
eukprot:TRINITY_DN3588_c0_g1_i2.p1 TRINITY_DN3588_c0_g1~~TRINITY_DN3588_c0_g1_i2.p1  ORF type:complete len:365 (+),score=62.98 TRINITY_DN3588_c0_g1_i2:112-1206(+)